MSIGIYKITSPSGSIYIGQSIEIEKRWRFHRSLHKTNYQPKLTNSLKKYGVENHLFEIIYELPKDCSKIDITNYEHFFIIQYKEAGIELLNTKDAELVGRHSESTKRKMSESSKGHRAWNKGIPHSLQCIEKLKIARSKRIITKETGIRISNALKGKPKSDDHKQKIRNFMTGTKRTIESIEKQKQTIKNKHAIPQ